MRTAGRIAALLAALVGLAGVAVLGAELSARARLESPPPSAVLVDSNGAFLAQVTEDGPRADYGFWPLPHVPERVALATLALEDQRFWSHPGVDPLAVGRAVWQRATGSGRSGASTLAMQIARMQRPADRSFPAKFLEAGTALLLTARYGREALLRHYLRLVPYGNGSHGIAHAARWYFDKPVDDLSWAEIAFLAALPQAPARMNPLRADGFPRALARAGKLLARLEARGVLTNGERRLAEEQLSRLRLQAPARRPGSLHVVLRLKEALHQSGWSPLGSDGRVVTTLDRSLQQAAETLLMKHVADWRGAEAEQAAALILDRRCLAVRAAVGSAGFFGTPGGALDFTRTPRSPGSTLKPFLFALALEKRVLRPDQVMADAPEEAFGMANADGQFLGPLLPRQALANSRNIPAATLLRTLGFEPSFRFFEDLGLHHIAVPAENFGLSMAIGGLPTRLDWLLQAYGALANDGILKPLHWYAGETQEPPRRLISAETARLVTGFLADPLARLPSFPRGGPTDYPFPVAVKTGTSQAYRDAWTIAYSDRYLIGVWVGRPDAAPMRQVTGAGGAAPLARALMLLAHRATAGEMLDADFPAPEGYERVALCSATGQEAAYAKTSATCGPILREWLPMDRTRAALSPALPPPLAALRRTEQPVALTITAPRNNLRLWRNPEVPDAANRLTLRVATDPPVAQVVWYADGIARQVSPPDQPFHWPIEPGRHAFQVRLPQRPEASAPVTITVE